MNYLKNLNKGFTLIEMLCVIILLGVLVAFAYPAVLDVYQDIKEKSMTLEENHVRNAAKMYVEDCFNTKTKDELNGCSYTDIITDSGHVFLGDMIYDGYTEAVSFGDTQCEGYVEFLYDKYTVCIQCGTVYKTDDLECTFDYEDTKFTTFSYKNEPQSFIVGKDQAGTYRIELWGASGTTSGGVTAYGAYTSGVIDLKENDVLYFYTGQSNPTANATAWNGGQGSGGGTPGGGATDVRLVKSTDWSDSTSLASRIMVAAGGGGGTGGAAGGGILGYSTGTLNNNATQLAGGQSSTDVYVGTFGKGGNGCGGGSGYYGGAGTDCSVGGGSGSSYISGHTGCVAIISKDLQSPKTGCLTGNTSKSCSLHFSGEVFTSTVMIDGNGYAWTNVRGNQKTMPSTTYGQYYEQGKGHVGNGYARVTYLGK